MVKINVKHDMSPETAVALFDWGLAVADIIVTDGERKYRLGDLTPAGVHYVADYGTYKSLADSVSGVKKAVKEAYDAAMAADKPDSKAWDKFVAEAKLPDGADVTVDSVTDAVINARQGKRFDAIVASALPVREGTGRLSPKDAWINKTALAEIKATHERKGAEMPKGAKLAEMTAKYVAALRDRFESDYAAHLARIDSGADKAAEILGL